MAESKPHMTTRMYCLIPVAFAALSMSCRPASNERAASVEATRPAEATGVGSEFSAVASLQASTPPVLWVRQILIRHADAPMSVPFGPAEFRFAQESTRSRVEAERLANELATRARAYPELFSELARERSDDEFTRTLGGMLGGLAPAQLRPWPLVRETLLQLQLGQVSGVIETEAGFHVFLREVPPDPAVTSGARIVIGYDAATWLHAHVARPGRAIPKRSRAEALDVATALYHRLAGHPELFPRLVDEYSDHRDAQRGGDFGQWSTDEPSAHPRQTAILQSMQVGQVHAPIDGMLGFEIILRTRNTERRTYAMNTIQLRFDPNAAPGTPFSKTVVADKATSLARVTVADPSRFDQLREQYCCARTKVWQAGRGTPALELALQRLPLDAIANEPVEVDHSFMIPRRLSPESAAAL